MAVAANFAEAQERLASSFEAATGVHVIASVGSTGQLYAQIRNGAPFDVFLAADTLRPARLIAEGMAVAGSRSTYARGRLALVSSTIASTAAARTTTAATAVGGSGDPAPWTVSLARPDARLAIANPETAPYGAAAVEALERLGLLERVAPRLVRGENVAQAYAFVASGAAEAGLVALALVVDGGTGAAPAVGSGHAAGSAPAAGSTPASDRPPAYRVVPDSLHSPIRQDAVLLVRAADRAAARRYLEFLRSDEARRLIEAAGYDTR